LPPQIFCVWILVFKTWTESAFRKKVIKILHIDVLCTRAYSLDMTYGANKKRKFYFEFLIRIDHTVANIKVDVSCVI